MDTTPTLIVDFDSTIVRLEGLDELARLALADDPKRDEAIATIEGITRQGMDGSIGIDEWQGGTALTTGCVLALSSTLATLTIAGAVGWFDAEVRS